jgi:hypothetical protein
MQDRGLLQAICMGYGGCSTKERYPAGGGALGSARHRRRQRASARGQVFRSLQAVFSAVQHVTRAAIAKGAVANRRISAMTVYSLPPLTGAEFAAEVRAGMSGIGDGR